ncbi:hypothetical protein DFR74_114118 [Nocardia puris]|uniref:Uncharacterized protein n=1 Tax=Nocardia puris TaxID=208602 RepID=A0A366D6H1_9NOCA|nr:hypothetical protein [Nocardia puris]RBO85576.1 hypothetical protein DFR74_114118 [Nocardia puris]
MLDDQTVRQAPDVDDGDVVVRAGRGHAVAHDHVVVLGDHAREFQAGARDGRVGDVVDESVSPTGVSEAVLEDVLVQECS